MQRKAPFAKLILIFALSSVMISSAAQVIATGKREHQSPMSADELITEFYKMKDTLNLQISNFQKNCATTLTGSELEKNCAAEMSILQNKKSILVKARALVKEVEALQKQIAGDQDAIRALGFVASAEQFQKWSELSEAQQKELIRETKALLVDACFLGAEQSMDVLSSISIKEAEQIKNKMESLGITNLHAQEAIILVGKTKDKKQKAQYAKDFLKNFKAALRTSPPDNASLLLLLNYLKPFIRSSQLAMTVTALQTLGATIESYAALYFLGKDVNNLINLTEDQLKILKQFTDALNKDVTDLNVKKKALRNALYLQ